MKKFRIFCSLLALLMLVGTCSEPIDLPVSTEGGQVVIFGRLTNGAMGSFVSVARTSQSGELPVPDLAASVRLINEQNETQELVAADSGIYLLRPGVVFGEVGTAYALEVESGGQLYRSELQRMPENYGRDLMSWELQTIEKVSPQGVPFTEDVVTISAKTEFDELPDEFFLRWDLEEAYTYFGTFLPLNRFPLSGGAVQCYVINDLNEQRIFLHNGAENRAPEIESRVFVDRLVDKSFQSLHYFNLVRASITKEAHDYWSKLDLIVNRQGSIFDVPPAPIKGNVVSVNSSEEVLGFFEVVSVDTTRLALTRSDVPIFFFDECEKRGAEILELFTVPRDCRQCLADEGIVDESCLYCGVLRNSTSVRPSYF